LYPVHPTTLAKFREAWYPSRSKSDPSDADLLLEILTTHRSRLRRLDPDTVEMRLLQNLVENRRKLVDERTALSNRLTDLLKLYFPQILGWFNDVASAVVGDLLEQWPSLQDLQRVKPAKLEKFLRDHHCSEIPERLTQIRQAIAATHDRALLDSAPHLVAAWVRQMAVLRESIRQLDKRIAELAAQQEDWPIFQSLPGAGAALAPRLMVAWELSAIAIARPATCNALAGSRRSKKPAATPNGCISGGPVRNFCARPFMNGRLARLPSASGLKPTTSNKRIAARSITSPYALWRSNGCASCTVVGKIANPTVRRSTWLAWPNGKPPW
jgi:hypothetical protein